MAQHSEDARRMALEVHQLSRRVDETSFADSKYLESVENQIREIKRIGEDATTIQALHGLVVVQSKMTRGAMNFATRVLGKGRGPEDFVQSMRAVYRRTGARGDFGPDDFDWDKLCREVRGMGMFRPVATSSHLLGALHVQEKIKKPKERVAAQRVEVPDAPVVNPELVQGEVEERDRAETNANMVTMFERLKDRERGGLRTRMVDLVMNMQSFAQFVENLFALSFLVKDGRVRLDPDAELGVMAGSVSRQEKAANEALPSKQIVVSYTMADWERLKAGVEECVMPHREEEHDAATPPVTHNPRAATGRRGGRVGDDAGAGAGTSAGAGPSGLRSQYDDSGAGPSGVNGGAGPSGVGGQEGRGVVGRGRTPSRHAQGRGLFDDDDSDVEML